MKALRAAIVLALLLTPHTTASAFGKKTASSTSPTILIYNPLVDGQ